MVISRRWQTEAGLASGREGTLIPGALDPIDAAKNDIAGSKDLIASVSDDLSQHYRWLESYRSSEIKHKRRLQRQEVMHQLELRPRRLMRFAKRVALTSFRWARAASIFVWQHLNAAFLTLRGLFLRGVARAAPYARAVARVVVIGFVWLVLEFRALLLALGKWFDAGWSWFRAKGGVLARDMFKAASIGFAWLAVRLRVYTLLSRRWLVEAGAWARVQAGVVARATANTASTAFAELTVKGKSLAHTMRRWLAASAAWLSMTLRALIRSTFGMVAAVSTQVAMKSRKFSRSTGHVAPPISSETLNHQALVPRPSTELVSIEPFHAALPVVQTGPQETVPRTQVRAKKPKKSKQTPQPRKRRVGRTTS
ncbi:MAG: hypothetical protein ACR2GC_06025 [Methyloceanibacter sp.]|uniref:hypothetical protein n=1 Tax=Methyloceanibacter sp. TaxID=1965321 RepID=UPI003D9AC962